MRGAGAQFLPKSALHVGEAIEVSWRPIGCERVCGEPRRLGLAEVVIGPRHQRGEVRGSVTIVGRLCQLAPLAEPREQLVLGRGLYPVAGGVGAVAAGQERNPWLSSGPVGAFSRLGNQFAVEDGRRLVDGRFAPGWGGAPRRTCSALRLRNFARASWSVPSIPIDLANWLPIVSADTG